MDYTLHRPSPPAATAAPPPYYPHPSYLSAPNPISAAAAANPYPSTAPNYVAAYAPYGRYAAAAADPGIGHATATTETPSYYYNYSTVAGTGGHSLSLNEGDAPSKDPGLGQAYHGGGYGAETFMDQGQGHASSSYYYSQAGGSGGGYGNGVSVAPFPDVGLGQARAALRYPYNSGAGGGGGYGNGSSATPYPDVGLGQARAALRYPYNSAAGGGGGGEGYGHGLVVKEAIRQYGVDPHAQQTQPWSSTGPDPAVLAQPSQIPPLRSNATINNTHPREMTRQPPMRVNKVAQPARCEVCKIQCNNKEVLMIHKQGKKHKRNMLKLQEAITAKPARAQVTVDKKDEGSSVASKDKVVGEQKKRAAPATVEDLQVKKKRILEGGAAASEIKICTICNVVVNSQQVLEYHLAGQKHAAMVEQQAS